MKDIDLVIPWVDGSDPKWLEERNKYLHDKETNPGFFQDWGWMRYWFRAVEENLPWIRNIFFVTYGHLPSWLNVNHPKLKIVKHEDFISKDFLPTFGCCTLTFNLHHIEGLSETFIYAEDDIFFLGKQQPTDFFTEDGLPRDYLWLKPLVKTNQGDFFQILENDLSIINKHFNMESVLKSCENKLEDSSYPEEIIGDNKKAKASISIPGIKQSHLAYSFLKSTFEEIWKAEPYEMFKTCMYKFRNNKSPCTMLFRDWQLVSGRFSPYYQQGRYYRDTASDDLEKLILDKNTKMLCINEAQGKEYTKERANEILSYFERRFPNRSMFELEKDTIN